MNDRKHPENNWTHEQLSSLLNALRQRSKCDSEVDYFADNLQSNHNHEDDKAEILPKPLDK